MKEDVLLPDMEACVERFRGCFPHVGVGDARVLFEGATVTGTRRGDLVYRENARLTGCYFLYSGAVKFFQTGQSGKDQIIRLGKEGDLFGFRSVIRNEAACTSVETLSDCVVCCIPNTVVLEMLGRSAGFAYEMMQVACRELGEANRYIRDMAQKSVRGRLAEVLLIVAGDFGMEADGTLRCQVTREDLGNFVGTATETLIRLLSELRAEGYIETRGRRIRLLDVAGLRRLAE